MQRGRSTSLIAGALVAALVAGGGLAAAKPKPPPKPPKPKITLLTGTEEAVLSKGKIKVEVRAKRAKKVDVSAQLVVDGNPEDYAFKLGPQRKGIRDGDATVAFKLSARQDEVLDFAAQTCRGASLAITAKTEKRTGRLSAELALPADC